MLIPTKGLRARAQMMSSLVFFILLIGMSACASGSAIDDVNTMRRAAGLSLLTPSEELQKAAEAHALYLSRYMQPGSGSQVSAHEEHEGLPEFTGKLAAERAQHFGYSHSVVLENVSLGNLSLDESISSLMSAIYHRFAFLDLQIDEIGIAQAGRRYVFDMGRKDLTQTCTEQVEGARILPPYNCLGQKMKSSAYSALCENLPAEAIHSPPFPSRCANGALLNNAFMQKVCEQPPEGAILKGAGRYYDACNNGLRISARWFEHACESTHPDVIYQHTGRSYNICSAAVPVHANWYQSFCANLPDEMLDTDSGRYYSVCRNGFQIRSEYFDEMNSAVMEKHPVAVLWPADGISNIQPVFYDEEPHPTPDLAMTGYPISIQFNPQMVDSVAIMGFELEREDTSSNSGWQRVSEIRLIDELMDINGKFTSHQFAWFPLRRLKWGAHYRYHIDVLLDGAFRRFTASFETTSLPAPVYEVSGEVNRVSVAENHFMLYREPDAYDNSPFKDVGLRYRDRPFVDIEVVDTNTIEINAGGSSCAPVLLSTRLNEEIYIDFCQNGKGLSRWKRLFQ